MKKYIAEKLLEIQAVALRPNDPFTWSSGLKSPVYCDNRLTLSYPEIRREIAKGLKDLILEKFPDAEVIAGTATAGIPHAAWVSELMNLPMCYVRSKAKGHGKGNQIEGKVSAGAESGRCGRFDFHRRQRHYGRECIERGRLRSSRSRFHFYI